MTTQTLADANDVEARADVPVPPRGPAPRRHSADQVLGATIAAAGLTLTASGLALGGRAHPFPWGVALLAGLLSFATRRFGIPLPGKGFTSFVIGSAAAGVAALGWAAGSAVAAVALFLGDLLLRRRPAAGALVTAGHLAFACVLAGLFYGQAGGAWGAGAARPANAGPLVLLLVLVPLVANLTFYLQVRLAPASRWVDPALTFRWEAAVIGLALPLAGGGLALLYGDFSPAATAVLAAAWLGLTGLAYWLVRQGVRGEGLMLVQRLSRAIGARPELAHAFTEIQGLTSLLVPWTDMGIAAYDPAEDEFVVLMDTADHGPTGMRVPARSGLPAAALERGGPVTDRALPARLRDGRPGSEIVVPLRHGERLVGLWTVRHGAAAMYDEGDAGLLGHLAPQLALSLSLDGLVRPVLDASEETARHVVAITRSARELRSGAEQAAASARRMAGTVVSLAETLSRGAEEAEQGRTVAEANATWGEATRRSGEEMVETARDVRDATAQAVARLEAAAAVVQEGADEVTRLQAVSGAVEHFRSTIDELAQQSSLLALNATIEAVRAGAHGRSFEVVAHELRALADRSATEARDVRESVQAIRDTLERAIGLMQRTRTEVLTVTTMGDAVAARLGAIVAAAEGVAATGAQIALSAQETAERSRSLAASLAGSQADARRAATASDTVAAGSREQFDAIESLNRAAQELAATAEGLATAAAAARAGRDR